MKHTLLYRIVPHNGGVVFAEERRAREIARLHEAFANATTWAEIRKMIPPKEYALIMKRAFDSNGEPRPRATDAFEPESIPGWSDGDYPPWLQSEMHRALDLQTLQLFGDQRTTALNGSYWQIDPNDLPQLLKHLEGLGVMAINAQDLQFH